MTIKRVLTGLGVAILAAAATVVVAAPPAAAAGGNGVCDNGEFCLYYNSGQSGSLYDFTGSLSDYGSGATCRKFVGPGAGKGQCMKNNAASARNNMAVVVTMFRKTGYAGGIDVFPGKTARNLDLTYNADAGHIIGLDAKPALSYSLYKTSGGDINCYFDGYITTNGRHEGIDIARGAGSQVRALVDGTVVSVVPGSAGTGTGHLSTIAIYNARLNKTIVYLHTVPRAGLGVNDPVDVGQVIATESNHGATAAHTHVEMRIGKKASAADSTDDPNLTNPNPTSFWRSQGYNIW